MDNLWDYIMIWDINIYKLHSTSFNYYTNWEIQLISWDSKAEFPLDFGTFSMGFNGMNTLW